MLSVAKVHNRHLRVQFEQASSSGSEGEGSKPCTDYMFYGEHPALPGEHACVALMAVVRAWFPYKRKLAVSTFMPMQQPLSLQ